MAENGSILPDYSSNIGKKIKLILNLVKIFLNASFYILQPLKKVCLLTSIVPLKTDLRSDIYVVWTRKLKQLSDHLIHLSSTTLLKIKPN